MRRWWRQGLAAVAAGVFLLPLYWAVVASLRQPGLPPTNGIAWWPTQPHWDNYLEIFRLLPLGRYLGNSLLVVAIAVPVTVGMASGAGFAMSQLAETARERLMRLSVALLLIPGAAVWLFRFQILRGLGLLDTVWALVLPAFAGSNPLFILLFYWTCRRIPPELFEAARLEARQRLDPVAAAGPPPQPPHPRRRRRPHLRRLLERLHQPRAVHLRPPRLHRCRRTANPEADGPHQLVPAHGCRRLYERTRDHPVFGAATILLARPFSGPSL